MRKEKLEQISILFKEKEKVFAEKELRILWQESFHDSAAYEEFYFHTVYPKNKIYRVENKGMLHLNAYPCMVDGKEMLLHYIVGVATKKEEQRKGIMRRLLTQALVDMYEAGEPFTYLMPADERYYRPFSFVSICKRKERKLTLKEENVFMVSAKEVWQSFSDTELNLLCQKIEEYLQENYAVYAKHDRLYFELLRKEKQCEQGDLIFYFEDTIKAEKIKGFFAYGISEEQIFIEQYVWFGKKDTKHLICSTQMSEEKKQLDKPVNMVEFPYMVRIVNVDQLISLCQTRFLPLAKKNIRLWITDEILWKNNAIYKFFVENRKVVVEKQNITKVPEENMWDLHMTVEELAKELFVGEWSTDKGIFFAEVV